MSFLHVGVLLILIFFASFWIVLLERMDSIIIALPETEDKRSIKLLNFLTKNNLYKIFVDENIKFVIKIFNKKNKTFFMDYKIYTAPSLYCCLEDDDIKINNFKDIMKWLSGLKNSIEEEKTSQSVSHMENNTTSFQKNKSNDLKNDISLTANDFMSNMLEAVSDKGDSDDDCSDLGNKYTMECEKREKNKTKNDPRSFNNIKSIQKVQKPFSPLPELELSNESYLTQL